ncbi:hypothetical protein Agub_g14771, partial [Astrephomene gubernaculifera]
MRCPSVSACGLLAILLLFSAGIDAAKKPPSPPSPPSQPPRPPPRRLKAPRTPPVQPAVKIPPPPPLVSSPPPSPLVPQPPPPSSPSLPSPSSPSPAPPSSPPASPSPSSAAPSSPPSPSSPSQPSSPPAPSKKQPNFVVILVDDQDYLLNATHRAYMPKLHQYIGDKGLHLNNFIVTTSLCCPSRVSLLTGRFTHNHNVTSNQAPQGGWGKFSSLALDRDWLPLWLKPLGYNTYFTGKFINLFDVEAGDTASCPKGWDMFDPLTDKSVYDYVNYDFMPQCARLDSFRDAYQTDTIAERAMGYIDDAVSKGAPFYLQLNPAACHTACPKGSEEGGACVPPVPAPKYAGRFSGAQVPRSPNWNLQLPSVLGLGDDLGGGIKAIDKHYQRRLETMLSVDDMIEAVVTKLEQAGVLDNTYVIYVSDNGYHLGNHGMAKGKTLPYEEDVRVPFYMRGPGVPAGTVSPYMATMVDLTATFVQLGGGSPPDRLDGVPLPLDRILPPNSNSALNSGSSSSGSDVVVPRRTGTNYPTTNGTLRQMLPIEMWINALSKDLDKKDYRSVRICTNNTLLPLAAAAAANNTTTTTTTSRSNVNIGIGNTTSPPNLSCWKYTVWCIYPTTTNYKELFDLTSDPDEINNLMT